MEGNMDTKFHITHLVIQNKLKLALNYVSRFAGSLNSGVCQVLNYSFQSPCCSRVVLCKMHTYLLIVFYMLLCLGATGCCQLCKFDLQCCY